MTRLLGETQISPTLVLMNPMSVIREILAKCENFSREGVRGNPSYDVSMSEIILLLNDHLNTQEDCELLFGFMNVSSWRVAMGTSVPHSSKGLLDCIWRLAVLRTLQGRRVLYDSLAERGMFIEFGSEYWCKAYASVYREVIEEVCPGMLQFTPTIDQVIEWNKLDIDINTLRSEDVCLGMLDDPLYYIAARIFDEEDFVIEDIADFCQGLLYKHINYKAALLWSKKCTCDCAMCGCTYCAWFNPAGVASLCNCRVKYHASVFEPEVSRYSWSDAIFESGMEERPVTPELRSKPHKKRPKKNKVVDEVLYDLSCRRREETRRRNRDRKYARCHFEGAFELFTDGDRQLLQEFSEKIDRISSNFEDTQATFSAFTHVTSEFKDDFRDISQNFKRVVDTVDRSSPEFVRAVKTITDSAVKASATIDSLRDMTAQGADWAWNFVKTAGIVLAVGAAALALVKLVSNKGSYVPIVLAAFMFVIDQASGNSVFGSVTLPATIRDRLLDFKEKFLEWFYMAKERVGLEGGSWLPSWDTELFFDSKAHSALITLVLSIATHFIMGRKCEPYEIVTFLSSVGHWHKVSNAFGDVGNYMISLLNKVVSFVRQKILGLAPLKVIISGFPAVEKWCREVDAIQESKNRGTFRANIDTAHRIYTLQFAARKLKAERLPAQEGSALRSIITEREKVLQSLLDKMSNIVGAGAGPRVEPHCILLEGAPGVGKTKMTTWLVQATLMQVLSKPERDAYERGEWSEYHYNRISSHEYWDNYTGQMVALFDDLGQFDEPPGTKDSEAQDIVRGVSGYPYAVHRAELENKGNSYFSSEFVVCTGNGFYTPSNMKDVDAYKRRIVRFHIGIKDKYVKGYKSTNGNVRPIADTVDKTHKRPDIDWTKVQEEMAAGDDFNPNIYEITRLDAWTNAVVETVIYKEPRDGVSYGSCWHEDRDAHPDCRCGEKGRFMSLTIDQLAEYNAQRLKINRGRAARYKNQLDKQRRSLNKSRTDFETLYEAAKTAVKEERLAKKMKEAKFESGLSVSDYQDALDDELDLAVKSDASIRGVVESLQFENPKIKDDVKDAFIDVLDSYVELDDTYDVHVLYMILSTLYTTGPSAELWSQEDFATWGLLMLRWVPFRYWFRAMKSRYKKDISRMYMECTCFWNETTRASFIECADMQPSETTAKVIAEFKKIKAQHESVMSNPKVMWATIIVSALTIAGIGAGLYTYFTSEKKGTAAESESMYGRHLKVRQDMRQASKAVHQGQRFSELFEENQNVEELADKVTRTNVFEVGIFTTRETILSVGYGFFPGADVFCFPNHFKDIVRSFTKKGLMTHLKLISSYSVEEDIDIDVREFLAARKVVGDVSVMKVKTHPKPKICKYFMTREELINYKPGKVMLMKMKNTASKDVKAYGKCVRRNFFVTPESEGEEVCSVERPFGYTVPTQRGDCGSLLYNYETVPKGRIMAMHFAANSYEGLGQPLTREDLESVLAQQTLEFEAAIVPEYFREDLDKNVKFVPTDSIPFEGESFVPYGKAAVPCGYSSWSQFKRSPLSGTYADSKKALAHLRRYTNKAGIEIEPFLENIKKYGSEVQEVNIEAIKVASQVVCGRILAHDNGFAKAEVWDTRTAVLGIPGHNFAKAIPRQTSAGYPYSAFTRKGGKKDFFGEGVDFSFDSKEWFALEKTVENMWKLLQKPEGQDLLIVFSDNLKDETLPKEKVDRKTRIFTGVPLDFYLIQRRAFGAFVEMLCEGRIKNGSSVGINVYSDEWDTLFHELTAAGDNVVAGDFSGFDASQVYDIFKCILDYVIQPYYNDGPEMYMIRKNIIWIIAHSYHIRGDVVYQWSKNMPSGNYLTAILNTLYSLVLICACYLVLHPTKTLLEAAEEYDIHVSAVAYGDDNAMGISDYVIEWFNQQSLAQAMVQFGMVYTPETKDEQDYLSRTIWDIAFLKRSFRYEPFVDKIVAPLDIDVILEIPMWTKRTYEADEIVRSNLRVALEELAYHEESVFEFWAPKMIKAASEYIDYVPPLQSWEHNLRLVMLRADE